MIMHCYENNSENNKLDKDLTALTTYNIRLLDNSSVETPVIKLKCSYDDMHFNYVYIEELGRYYYVTDKYTESDQLWVVSLRVDVLSTYKDAIRRQFAIINRNENLYNMYLNDSYFKAVNYQQTQAVAMTSSTGFPALNYFLLMAK